MFMQPLSMSLLITIIHDMLLSAASQENKAAGTFSSSGVWLDV